jgi:hypothetical protein
MARQRGWVGNIVIASHVALVGLLLAVSIPQAAKIPEQLGTGYVPTAYGVFVAMVGATVGLAVGIAIALVAWFRRSRRWLVIADALASLAAWSVLWLYLFANDLPILIMALAPLCLVVAVGATWLDRRNRVATG